MPSYIIRNTDTGEYVARPGLQHSYTHNLSDAQTWKTREAAESNKCGNECIEAPCARCGFDYYDHPLYGICERWHARCDGDHAAPRCSDAQCWQGDEVQS